MYKTSCATCHTDFPKLNDFGKAFKDAGFKFPSDDETFLKIPPVLLGAPAQKDMFPHSIWPGSIPGMPPIGLRMNNFFTANGKSRGNFNTLFPPGTVTPYIPKTDFETGYFSIFTAGNFGSNIAFWVDDDFSIGGDNSAGGLGDAYLKFVNVSRFLHMPKDSLSFRVGQFELDLPVSQARNINISPYDIYGQANMGAINPAFPEQNVNNASTLSDPAKGFEFSGGHQYGGYHYSLAIVDQNTSGIDQPNNDSAFLPTATGAGYASDSNFKDLYGRFSYRWNLERDSASRNAIQAAGAMGPRDHTYIAFGSYFFYGRSVQRFTGADTLGNPQVLTAREPFYRAGGDFNFNYRNFNLFGVFMHGRDQDLLPVDSTGAIIPLPLSLSPVPVGFVHGTPVTFTGGFVEADYLVLPWVMGIMRWDAVNSTSDRLNALALNTGVPFVQAFDSTRNRFTPGVQFLLHANIKASFEYQVRPQQVVTIVTNPGTGLPMAIHPFRTNQATASLEWVY